jgi:3-deoxy-7-phosphoheptulonate synthase
MGAERVADLLPPLLAAGKEIEQPIAWICDPMHGNLIRTASGTKTRRLEDILTEIRGFFEVCREAGVWPGGVHLEFTGEHVTECLGGSQAVVEDDLDVNYSTLCDPRLNARQSLDLAFRVAELMRVPEA